MLHYPIESVQVGCTAAAPHAARQRTHLADQGCNMITHRALMLLTMAYSATVEAHWGTHHTG